MKPTISRYWDNWINDATSNLGRATDVRTQVNLRSEDPKKQSEGIRQIQKERMDNFRLQNAKKLLAMGAYTDSA
jgi:hypothetical protein